MNVDAKRLEELSKKITLNKCPLCGNDRWIAGNVILYAGEYIEDGETKETVQNFPMIPIICDNCGNTYFLNAIVSKILDNPKPKEKQQQTVDQNDKL